jgi:hypothetical protein
VQVYQAKQAEIAARQQFERAQDIETGRLDIEALAAAAVAVWEAEVEAANGPDERAEAGAALAETRRVLRVAAAAAGDRRGELAAGREVETEGGGV